MENKLIFKDKELKKVDNHVLGISGENEQEMLVFCFEDGFVDGTCYLELEFPNSEKYSIETKKDEQSECYRLEVKNSLLKQEGIMKMQLKIIQETAVWKSITFKMHILEAINAVESIEDDYPTFVGRIEARMQEIEEGFKQIDKKVDNIKFPEKLSDLENDLDLEGFSGNYEDLENKPENLVQDENYVHTDNNFTNEEKEKLETLESYDDTKIKQELRK